VVRLWGLKEGGGEGGTQCVKMEGRKGNDLLCCPYEHMMAVLRTEKE
jgi:hypothetical protein